MIFNNIITVCYVLYLINTLNNYNDLLIKCYEYEKYLLIYLLKFETTNT